MKIELGGTAVISTSTNEVRKFGVNQGAQMFKVLSNTLYSDKIRAIIRELSCNAWDSHVAAGVSTMPFEIHLPTMHETWFAIKDYGTGLSHENLMELFCTYFGSNKTDSNLLIGALGLGSKSPFCYTDQFTVKSTFNGVTRVYTARVDEKGEPTVQQMGHDAPTSRLPNGLEIKFSVKQNDVWEFENKAKRVLEFFTPRPIINLTLDVPVLDYQIKTPTWGLRKGDHGSRAVMGNIAYAVGSLDISRTNHKIQKIAELPLDIFFEIGDLSFTASRESLELDEKTVNKLITTYENIYAGLLDAVKKELDRCKNGWAARLMIYDFRQTNGLGQFVTKAWDDGLLYGDYTNFTLGAAVPSIDTSTAAHTALFDYGWSKKSKYRASKSTVFLGHSDAMCQQIAHDLEYDKVKITAYQRNIQVSPKTVFMINDLGSRGEKFINYHIQQPDGLKKAEQDEKTYLVFTQMDFKGDIDLMRVEAMDMLRQIGNPDFTLVSSLVPEYEHLIMMMETKRKRNRVSVGRRPVLQFNGNFDQYRNEECWSKAWKKAEGWESIKGTKYYVAVERLKCSHFESALQLRSFINHVRTSEAFGLDPTTPVYGLVAKSAKRKKRGWVELFPHVMNRVQKIMTPKREAELALIAHPYTSGGQYDTLIHNVNENPSLLSADSPFQRFAATLHEARKALRGIKPGFREILNCAERLEYYKRGSVIDLNKSWERCIRNYPLLHMVGSFSFNTRRDETVWHAAVLDYIRLIDQNVQVPKVKAAAAATIEEVA